MADLEFVFDGNAGELLNSIRDIRKELAEVKEGLAASKKEMQEYFQSGAKSGEQFNSTLKDTLSEYERQKNIIDQISKKYNELEQAQKKASNAGDNSAQQQKIKQLQDEISKLKKNYNELGEESKKAMSMATTSIVQYLATLDAAKTKLATLKEGSAEYKNLAAEIAAAEVAQKKLTIAVDENGDAIGGSRSELKAMREALIALKKDGLDTTDVYNSLKKAAGELGDTIADVNEEFKAVGSDTSQLDKTVRSVQLATNAFGIYEGIMGLTGERNEEFEKTLLKLNGIMVITNSLQQIMSELKRKDNVLTWLQIAAQKAYAIAVGTSTGAMKAFRIALATTGIGLIIIALAEAARAMKIFGSSTDDAADAQDRLRQEIENVNNSLAAQANFFGRAEKEELARARARGASDQEIFNIQQKYRKLNYNASVEHYNKVKVLDENEGAKALDNLKNQQTDAIVAQLDFQTQQREKRKQSYSQGASDAKQAANEAIAAQREVNRKIIELEKQLAKAKIDAMTEGISKDVADENNTYSNNIADLEAQKAEAKNKKVTDLINKNIEQEKVNHLIRLVAIQTKYYDDAEKAYTDAQNSIDEVKLTDQKQELDAVEKHYEEIANKIKEAKKKAEEYNKNPSGGAIDTSAFDDQQKAIEEKKLKDIAAINKKYALEKIKTQEDLALAQNEILLKSSLTEEQLEELKETNKLNILIKFAKERIKILEALSDEESKLEIAKLTKVVQESKKALKDKSKNQKTLFEWLGLTKEDEAQLSKYIDVAKEFGEAMSNALEGFIQLYDAQIQKSQESIDAITDKIDSQQEAVDTEKELADQGYANNLELEQMKLEDLKKQKDQELKIQEEVKKKKEAMQKAQIIADSISQISNLITAATQIFSVMSSIPIVGVALAIAMIGVMFAGFAAAKAAAWKNVGKAESGRRVAAGNRHSAGGNKYQSIDGNDPDILEIEEGEWVVNRKSSKKYDPILEAINNDELSGMSRHELSTMLKPIGIHLQDDLPKKVVEQYHASATSATKVVVVNNDDSRQWEKQNQILEKIADKGKQVTYHDGYRIEKEGNFIRKIFDKPNDY